MKKIILNSIAVTMLVCCVGFANAKEIVCHNYKGFTANDPPDPSLCEKSNTTRTPSGDDIYVEINCENPGKNECPSCRLSGVVNGNIANYNERDILNFAWARIAEGITTGELNYNDDNGVHLTWEVKPDNTISITFTSNN